MTTVVDEAGITSAGTDPSPYLTPWNPIYCGVDHAVGAAARTIGRTTVSPRIQRVNALRIDLSAAGLDFVLTPERADGAGNGQTTGAVITEFMTQNASVVLAINANFSACAGQNFESGKDYGIAGLAIRNGILVSDPKEPVDSHNGNPSTRPSVPDTDYAGAMALLIRRSTQGLGFTAAFESVTAAGGALPTDVYAAVAGSPEPEGGKGDIPVKHVSGPLKLVTGGVNQCSPDGTEELAGRTVVGTSADASGRYLYLVTIEGCEHHTGFGADFFDAAEWLLQVGAMEGINLDGGGSTVMAKYDASTEAPILLSTPYGDEKTPGQQRAVGFFLGIVAAPLG